MFLALSSETKLFKGPYIISGIKSRFAASRKAPSTLYHLFGAHCLRTWVWIFSPIQLFSFKSTHVSFPCKNFSLISYFNSLRFSMAALYHWRQFWGPNLGASCLYFPQCTLLFDVKSSIEVLTYWSNIVWSLPISSLFSSRFGKAGPCSEVYISMCLFPQHNMWLEGLLLHFTKMVYYIN